MHISGARFVSFSAFCSLTAVVVFVVDPVTCIDETQDGPLEYPRWLHQEVGFPSAPPKSSTSGKRLTKREAYRFQGHIQCTEVSVEGGANEGNPVREVKANSYKFLLRPKEDFQRIIFRMLIDNAFDVQPPYIYGNYLAVTREMLERDSSADDEDEWLEFHVEYYQHEVTMGRDKLALRVTVGNKTRPLITRRWWRTHSYSGFQISIEGGGDFLFDCAAHELIQNAPVYEAGQPLLLWGVLGSCFLLFLAGWVLYIAFRRRRRRRQGYEDAPPVPDLPKSLLLGMDKVNHSPDAGQHIYDEFDEDTLSRLRQKLNATTLGNAVDGSSKNPSSQLLIPSQTAVENEYDIPKNVPLRARPCEEERSSSLLVHQQERVYMNEEGLSLVEEKIKATSGIRDSMPETHYIEMNGIVNRGSIDMGKSQGQ